jgi:hypothetical protein
LTPPTTKVLFLGFANDLLAYPRLVRLLFLFDNEDESEVEWS